MASTSKLRFYHDGLAATLHYPKGKLNGSRAHFAVLFYGFPSGPSGSHHPFVQKLIGEGFVVAEFEYPGTYSSKGEFVSETCVSAALRFLKLLEQGKAFEPWSGEWRRWKLGKLVLFGSSFGGWTALCAGAKSKRVDAVFSTGGVTDWKTMYAHDKASGFRECDACGRVIQANPNLWRISKKEFNRFKYSYQIKFSPTDAPFAKALSQKPVLLVNGADDNDVPPSQSAELYAEMLRHALSGAKTEAARVKVEKNFGKTHQLALVPNEGHAGFNLFLKPNVWKTVKRWLRAR